MPSRSLVRVRRPDQEARHEPAFREGIHYFRPSRLENSPTSTVLRELTLRSIYSLGCPESKVRLGRNYWSAGNLANILQ